MKAANEECGSVSVEAPGGLSGAYRNTKVGDEPGSDVVTTNRRFSLF